MHRSTVLTARPVALVALFALQAFCVATLIGDVVGDVVEARSADPGGDDDGDGFEALVVAALVFGLVVTAHEIWGLLARQKRLEDQLRAASGAFQQVVEGHFSEWGLTAAERDVAMLALKGLSIAEIAGVRDSREGTVKAQCSAIYRKAGVSGRPQLISLFIEELMSNTSSPTDARAEPA